MISLWLLPFLFNVVFCQDYMEFSEFPSINPVESTSEDTPTIPPVVEASTSEPLPSLSSQSTLIHVHAIWRHGHRHPEWYPANTPKEVLQKYPHSQLTDIGISQMIELGQLLRRHYKNFLPSQLSVKDIYVRSSNYDRTLMSAEAFLDGFTSEEQDSNLKAKYLPIRTVAKDRENLFSFNFPCPEKFKEQKRIYESPEYGYVQLAQKESEFIQKMMNFTGSNLTFQHEYQLLDYILMSREGDLPLPEWVTDEVYNHVDDVNIKINQALLGSQKLLRLRGGPFLKEFSERLGKIASKGPNEKFFGYSAHDHSLANLFRVMNVLVKRWPPVGSAMLFELHRREENEYFVKILFRNGTSNTLQEIRVPQCHGDCHLQTFLAILKPLIPVDWYAECGLTQPEVNIASYSVLIYLAVAQSIVMVLLLIASVVVLARVCQNNRKINPLEKLDA